MIFRGPTIFLCLALCLLVPEKTSGQDLSLPPGAETTWIVDGAEEIIAYFVFDAELVAERLPKGMVFVTLASSHPLAMRGLEHIWPRIPATPSGEFHFSRSFDKMYSRLMAGAPA